MAEAVGVSPKKAVGLFAVLLLIGCLAACSDDSGKNAPLPVKSTSDARAWAEGLTEQLARDAGTRITPGTEKAFTPCTGKHGGTAPDDRYTLMYSVFSAVPLAQHPAVVRQARDAMAKAGDSIDSYQETRNRQMASLVRACDRSDDFLVVSSTAQGVDRMVRSVDTPCWEPTPPRHPVNGRLG